MTPPLDDDALQVRKLLKQYHLRGKDVVDKTKELLERYHLGWDVLELFKAYGEHHHGVEPPDALGRRLRTSALMRTCTNTISSLAVAMQKNPTPECMAECSEIIACCTDMLNIANESSQDKILPFMKLPLEIRQMVYHFYFKNLLLAHPSEQGRIIANHPRDCSCSMHTLKGYTKGWAVPLDMSLIYTCSHIKDEALKVWFEDGLFDFECGCKLRHCLRINKAMKYSLKNVRVHWTGRQSGSAFKLLQNVPRLRRLVVVVSRSTTLHLSAREALLSRYWPSRRQTRIPEALGFEELAKLVEQTRPEKVEVEHVERFQAYRRSDQDRSGLEGLLSGLANGNRLEG